MMPQTKKLLQRSAAVLGLVALAGGVYMFSSSGGSSFQADLLAQDAAILPDVEVETLVIDEGSSTVSSVFDATPTTEGASLSETGTTMTGSVLSGVLLTEISTTAVDAVEEEVRALENLRPAAAEQATNLLSTLGFSNSNQNTAPVEISSAATTLNTNALPVQTNAAAEALQSAPNVPQTGPESLLLIVAILCATMGMTLLLSEPRQV